MLLYECFYIAFSGPLLEYLATTAVRHHHRRGGASRRRETITGNNPLLLHVAIHVLQGVKAKDFAPFPSQSWLR